MADQQQLILRQLLEEPINREDNPATVKAKFFYASCMNLSKKIVLSSTILNIHFESISAQIREIYDKPLKKLLKSYGGWPLLEKNWKKPNQSIEQLMGKMRSELNEHFLVSILVGPDDKNSSVNILLVSK